MLFKLHHAQGTLTLSATNREQVIAWSRRQLGSRGGFVSITESDPMDADPSVEKDGTGISAMEAGGCHPIVDLIETAAQDVISEHGRSRFPDHQPGYRPWRLKEQAWH